MANGALCQPTPPPPWLSINSAATYIQMISPHTSPHSKCPVLLILLKIILLSNYSKSTVLPPIPIQRHHLYLPVYTEVYLGQHCCHLYLDGGATYLSAYILMCLSTNGAAIFTWMVAPPTCLYTDVLIDQQCCHLLLYGGATYTDVYCLYNL